MNTTATSPTPRRRPMLVALAASTVAMAGPALAQQDVQQQQQRPYQTQEHQHRPQQSGHSSMHTQRTSQAQSIGELIRTWPSESRQAAEAMLQKYGEPDVASDELLVWRDNGPWLRTLVHREPVQHDFPLPHQDVLEQVIAYQVPPEKFSELARFDGSLVANRTAGELAVRCGEEAANYLALNLAHDIVEGERSVEEARSFYARTIQELMRGERPEYAQGLQFETRTVDVTADPDEQVITERVAASESGRKGAGAAAAAAGAAAAGAAAGAASRDDAGAAASRQAGAASSMAREPGPAASPKPRAEADSGSSRDAAGTGASGAGAAAARGASQGQSIASMLTREFSGKDVLSSDGEVVGEVEAVTTDSQGRHVARIELDGFLGLGDDEMSLPLSELTIAEDGNLRVAMSRDEIEAHGRQQDRGSRPTPDDPTQNDESQLHD